MNEYREHPYATLATAGIFILIVLFFTMIAGVGFYLAGWTDNVFEVSKWAMVAIAIGTFFGLVAVLFDWLLGVNDG